MPTPQPSFPPFRGLYLITPDDADTGRLDEYIMTLGLVWRFRKAKKLDFADELAVYEREVADAIMRDGSRPRLSMNMVSGERVPRPPTTPDTLVFP